MIVIIDTTQGEAYNFKTRKDAGRFIGVSLPTLRGWLTHPFFLYRTLIITSTGNGKIEKSKKALNDKIRADFERAWKVTSKDKYVPVSFEDRDVRVKDSRPEESTYVDRSGG